MGMRVFTRPSFVCVCEFYLGRESFHFLNVSRPVRLYIGESSLRPIGLEYAGSQHVIVIGIKTTTGESSCGKTEDAFSSFVLCVWGIKSRTRDASNSPFLPLDSIRCSLGPYIIIISFNKLLTFSDGILDN